MRESVRKAQEMDIWQKQQERDILKTEVIKLEAERDRLMIDMKDMHGQLRGEAPAADSRPPMPSPPAAPLAAPPLAAPASDSMLSDSYSQPPAAPLDVAQLAQTPNPSPVVAEPAPLPVSLPPQAPQVAPAPPVVAPVAPYAPAVDPFTQQPVAPIVAPQVFDEGE